MPKTFGELSATTPLSDSSVAALRPASDERASKGRISLLLFCRSGARVVPLVHGKPLVLGRMPPADIVIDDESISREHARMVLRKGKVSLEDLDSTNGTRVDGRRIDSVESIEPGAQLSVGRISAAVQLLGSLEDRQFGLFSHEAFELDLEAEVVRARSFGRPLALLLIRDTRTASSDIGAWFLHLQRHLRAFDRIAFYGSDLVEVLLPEADEDHATALMQRIRQEHPSLVAGLATFPAHGSSAGELLQASVAAARKAASDSPIRAADTVSPGRIALPVEGEAAGAVVQNLRMCELFRTAKRLSSSTIPVLILGETGTGKELVARAVHEDGPRRQQPLICINCAAMPDSLVESTLFGHEKGVFTGADRRRKGLFEEADGGTVFLDEVGELPASAQASLLRVLETGCFCRVGSATEIEVDVRVVAATNRDLHEMSQRGAFREDLLYRINTMTLEVPPLRERADELEPLAKHFVKLANEANERQIRAIHIDVIERLARHTWPGNVRELRNTIERAVVIAGNDVITVADLPRPIRGEAERPPPLLQTHDSLLAVDPDGAQEYVAVELDLRAEVERFERQLITETLRRADWSRRVAAERLCIPRRTLAHKIAKYGIEPP